MKKTLSLIFAFLFILTTLAGCAQTEQDPTASSVQEQTPETTTPAPTEQETSGSISSGQDEFVDDYVDDDDLSDKPEIVEHQMLDEVPSSFSLVGTKHLPPIDNQGGIGTCASEGVTYMQFTNAVSRYIESKGLDSKWNPSSGNEAYIFAPKFTYNFAGAGTAWVYNVLKDHGALPLKDCQFYSEGGYKFGTSLNNRKPQSLSWPVNEGELESALNYRITDYEQIWTSSFKNQFTTSETGKDLIYKIKDAVVQGNVVVTGGFSSSWQYAYVSAADAKKGTGKVGEGVCVWCDGLKGGHQVSIVGYDDNFVCTYMGVELKGAFLVANSWGNWMNNGYFWVMYDSINKVSEYSELNLEGRENSMDQFCFIYWDKDISIGMPKAYVTVELTVTDREGFYIDLTKTDNTDVCTTYTSSLFNYGLNFENTRGSRDLLKMGEDYFTFSGNIGTEAERGFITLGYQGMFQGNSRFEDFIWGVNIHATKCSVQVHKITLYDGSGTKRAEIVPAEDIRRVKYNTECRFVFDLGNELKPFHNVGTYKLKNTGSGLYISPYRLLLRTSENYEDAAMFNITFDLINRYHVIYLADKIYLLDVMDKTIADGARIQFNAKSVKRKTQKWKVVQRDDGTFNIRLAADTRFALGMKDGEIVLVSGKDILDYGTWIFDGAGNLGMFAVVRYDKTGKLMISGSVPREINVSSLTAKAYKADGTPVKDYVITTSEDRSFALEAEGLEPGEYLFTFVDEKGACLSSCFYVIVK